MCHCDSACKCAILKVELPNADDLKRPSNTDRVQHKKKATVLRCCRLSNILHPGVGVVEETQTPTWTQNAPSNSASIPPLLMKEHTVGWSVGLWKVGNKNITCFHLGYLHSSFTHTKGSGILTAYWSGTFSSSGVELQKKKGGGGLRGDGIRAVQMSLTFLPPLKICRMFYF